MVKIVKIPGNGRLNNLNDPVLNVIMSRRTVVGIQAPTHSVPAILTDHKLSCTAVL